MGGRNGQKEWTDGKVRRKERSPEVMRGKVFKKEWKVREIVGRDEKLEREGR